MIFSNAKNTEKLKASILDVKFNSKGNLRLKVVDKENPGLEPGFITFSGSELKKIKRALET